MSRETTPLERSARDFKEKKEACLNFCARLVALKKKFDADFPAGEDQGDGPGRLDVARLGAIEERIGSARLKILVAGQFKAGKSTLLNAMLGDDVLPNDVLPCTAVITEIEYGEKPAATLYFKESAVSGSLPPQAMREVREHLQKHGPKAPPLTLDIASPELLADCLSIPIGMEQREGVRESPYAKCVLQWPFELCANDAAIIDSPGLNEHESRDATTMGYLDQADMIVHVLNAQQLCGLPDKKFIEDVRSRGNSRFPIIFVVNRIDQIAEKNRPKVVAYARSIRELDGVYHQDGIFFTAAAAALEARRRNDPEGAAACGIEAVEKKIAEVFERDRAKIKLGHLGEVLTDLEAFTRNSLPDLQKFLDANAGEIERKYMDRQGEFQDLERRIADIRNKVNESLESFQVRLNTGLQSFFDDFIANVLPVTVENASLDEISIFSLREDQEKATRQLNEAVNLALKECFRDWCQNSASELESAAYAGIRERIRKDVEDFNKNLGRLRSSLGLRKINLEHVEAVELGDYLPEMLAGAGVGGAMGSVVGGVAFFVLSRFLPVIAGPVGWAIVAVTTIGSIVLAMSASDDVKNKFKNKYLEEARRGLRKNLESHMRDIGEVFVSRFSEKLARLYKVLYQQIDDAKRPVKMALEALNSDKDMLARRKASLGEYAREFDELRSEGARLMQSL